MYNVELMTKKEVPKCVVLGLEAHKDSGYKNIDLDIPWTIRSFNLAVDREDMWAVTIKKETKVIGYMLAVIAPFFFSPVLHTADITFFINSKDRALKVSNMVLDAYVTWAKVRGAKVVTLGNSTQVNTNKIARYYSICGFKQIGTQHWRII